MSETPQTEGMSVDCEAVRRGALVEDYLLARLSEPVRDAFEAHFFECEECYARLEAARLLGQELRASGAKAAAVRRPTRTWLATAAGLATLALGVGVYTLHRGAPTAPAPATAAATRPEHFASPTPVAPEPPPGTLLRRPAPPVVAPNIPMPSPTPPPVPSPTGMPAPVVAATPGPRVAPPGSPVSSVRELGRFDPPRHVPEGNADPSPAGRQFERGMAHYSKGDYRSAAPDLRSASVLGPDSAKFAFYAGVSSLLADDVETGIASLQKTLALGPSPHREAAAFYLAKGLLLKGDRVAADTRLRVIAASPGQFQAPARELLDQLRARP